MDTQTFLADLGAVNWSQAPEHAEPLLRAYVAAHPALGGLLQAAQSQSHLKAMCEQYDLLLKLVLFQAPGDAFRLRLHIFREGYFDRPHNHRWNYTALILRGEYRHTLYAPTAPTATGALTLTPLMTRTESAGSAYSLTADAVHAVVAAPMTVSLIARGPAVADRFFVHDVASGRSWWQQSATRESESERAQRRLAGPELDEAFSLAERLLRAG